MDLIMKQMPVVVSALNVGFLQTLKLFIVTLIGALPLGLVIASQLACETDRLGDPWYPADDPTSDHLLFPRAGLT